MDDQILDLLENLIDGRNDFFHNTIRLTAHPNRPAAISRYMVNEVLYLETINRVYQNYLRNQIATNVLTFTLPSNFLENVPIVPTQAQVTAALEDIESSNTNCAICQESISSGGARVQSCGHVFHRTCIVNWFGMSVRCPVCRHDIRQSGQEAQTPPASEQTSVQSEDQ